MTVATAAKAGAKTAFKWLLVSVGILASVFVILVVANIKTGENDRSQSTLSAQLPPAQAATSEAIPAARSVATEPDSSDWYLVAARMTEAALSDPSAAKASCELNDGGPATMIDVFQRVGQPHEVVDREKAGDRVMQVEVRSGQGSALFVRGKSRCERVVAKLNAKVSSAETSRQAQLSRYK